MTRLVFEMVFIEIPFWIIQLRHLYVLFAWIFGQLHEKFHIKLKYMEFQQLHEAASMLCMNAISNEHSHIEHISMPLFNGPCTIINNINWLMAAHLMLRQSDEIFWKIAVARNTTHAKSNPNKLSPVRLWSCDVLWNNDSNLILFYCETLFEISFGHFMEMNGRDQKRQIIRRIEMQCQKFACSHEATTIIFF